MKGKPLRDLLPVTQLDPRDPSVASRCVSGIQHDSRRVQPGDVFVAIEGLQVDGHEFADKAAEAGAVAIIATRPLEITAKGRSVPCIVVEDSARALGLMACRLYDQPTNTLRLTGITGTNGKTTTAFILAHLLQQAGQRPGLVGTVVYRWAGHCEPAPYTTPDAIQLQRLLRRMADDGCDHAVMEVSSHGLQLGRVWGCEFGVAAFSNLTQDHLDLHGDMRAYLEAKLLLFRRHLGAGGTAVVNVDGAGGEAVVAAVLDRGDVQLIRCSRNPATAAGLSPRSQDRWLLLTDLHGDLGGIRGVLQLGGEQHLLRSPLVGDFNADNLLLAAGCAHALGLSADQICAAAAGVAGVPGRLERVYTERPFAVFVDYAHTPDALARALQVLRPLCRRRLLVVFGCGGDRDRGKRPLMARAAAAAADVVVVTSDNPRSEDPQAIIDEILPGLTGHQPELVCAPDHHTKRGYWVCSDRASAINLAVRSLSTDDVLLVAGKGHEDYQILGNQRIHFDDREQVREALQLAQEP